MTPSDIKSINVRLSESLHDKAVSVGRLQGLNVTETYVSALNDFINKGLPAEALPEGINPEIFRAMARLMMQPAREDDEALVGLLMAVLRQRYGLDGSVTIPSKSER